MEKYATAGLDNQFIPCSVQSRWLYLRYEMYCCGILWAKDARGYLASFSRSVSSAALQNLVMDPRDSFQCPQGVKAGIGSLSPGVSVSRSSFYCQPISPHPSSSVRLLLSTCLCAR